MSRSLARSTLAAVAWLAAPARAATLRGPADLATLTRAADAVVHARVVSTESAWGDGGPKSGVIYTRVLLEPIAWWKGGAPGTVSVRVPGGAVGGIGQLVQGAAQFAGGEEVVVFLRKLQAPVPLFEVQHWSLGKFTVLDDGGGRRAVRSRSGLECVGCGAEADGFALGELKTRVQEAARARSAR